MRRFDTIELIIILLVIPLAVGFLLDVGDFRKRNASLQAQLDQTQQQLKEAQQQLKKAQDELEQQKGRPINIADLSAGNWAYVDDRRYAFVQQEVDEKTSPPFAKSVVGPKIAVYCESGEVPYHFSTADVQEQVKDFLKKHQKEDSPPEVLPAEK